MERSSSSAQNPFCPKRCLCKSLGWKNNSLKSNKVRTVSERCVEVKGTLGMLVQWVVSSGRKHLSNLNIKTNAKWTSMHFFTCWQLNPGSNRTILKKVLSPRFTCAPNVAYHIHITCLLVTAGGRGQGAVVFYKPTRSHITGYFQEHLRTFKDVLVVTKTGVFWEPESHFYLYLLHLKQLFFKASCRQFQLFLCQIHMNFSRVVDHLHLRVWRPKQLFQDARFTECSFCIPWHRQVCRRNPKADKIRQKTPARCPLHLQLSLMTKAFRYLDLLDNLMKV